MGLVWELRDPRSKLLLQGILQEIYIWSDLGEIVSSTVPGWIERTKERTVCL